MTSHSVALPLASNICAHIKHLGYAAARRVRLYGEEFEVVSDPFPDASGVAMFVTTKKDPGIRVLRIPVTVLQIARRAKTPLPPLRVESVTVKMGERSSCGQNEGSRSW